MTSAGSSATGDAASRAARRTSTPGVARPLAAAGRHRRSSRRRCSACRRRASADRAEQPDAPTARRLDGDLRRRHRRSRACSASCARSSRRTTSAPPARSTRSRSRSRSRTSSARSSPTRRSPSAFVPVFSELLEKGERKRAWRVASTLFWLMLLGLTALTALFILVAPWVIGIFGNPGHDRALAVGLSRVLFPIVALLGVSGIVVGILNSYDHFTVPALSPVFWNLAIIVGLAIGVPQAHTMNTKLYVYAVSILVATVIQVFLPMPWLRGRDGTAAARARLARPGGQARLRADGPGHARPRADQRQRGDRHVLRVAAHRRELRADGDPEGVPRLHAPAGDVLGRDRDRALPVALAPRDARRHGRLPAHGQHGPAADRVPAHPGGGRERRARRADRAHPLPARPLHAGADAGRRRTRSRRSAPGSSSTARC